MGRFLSSLGNGSFLSVHEFRGGGIGDFPVFLLGNSLAVLLAILSLVA